MLDPIVISEFGETLAPYPSSLGGYDPKKVDPKSYELRGCFGVHLGCGFVNAHRISESHNALVCSKCYFRIVIPQTVETWADLEEWFWKSAVADPGGIADPAGIAGQAKATSSLKKILGGHHHQRTRLAKCFWRA